MTDQELIEMRKASWKKTFQYFYNDWEKSEARITYEIVYPVLDMLDNQARGYIDALLDFKIIGSSEWKAYRKEIEETRAEWMEKCKTLVKKGSESK